MILLNIVSFPTSAFPALALGFLGLGTGFLTYRPQELFSFPPRGENVDLATGVRASGCPVSCSS